MIFIREPSDKFSATDSQTFFTKKRKKEKISVILPSEKKQNNLKYIYVEIT